MKNLFLKQYALKILIMMVISSKTLIANPIPVYYDYIFLSPGWNLISIDLQLFYTEPEMIFASQINNGNLQMVTGFQNQQGVFFDPDGPPQLNTLTQMQTGEAYWVKIINADILIMEGLPIPGDFDIDLATGWNLIGYWLYELQTPEDAFAQLIDAEVLELVTSYEQGGVFFDPTGAPFLNTLSHLKNGYGYWIKVSEGYEGFTFPEAVWSCGLPFMDIRDNQVYESVQIGEQCWMAENLNIGNMINGVENMTNNWVIEKYCYDNDPDNCNTYGGLYQWDEMMEYSTAEGVQGICPYYWHIPTDSEWCELEQEVDTTITCSTTGWRGVDGGGKLKEVGTTHWYNPNTGATNESGFTALPGGIRSSGGFNSMGAQCIWRTSSQYQAGHSWTRHLTYFAPQIRRYSNTSNSYGFSVRCLKN